MKSLFILLLALGAVVAFPDSAFAVEARVRIVAVDGLVAAVTAAADDSGGMVVVEDGRGRRHRVRLDASGAIKLTPLTATPVTPRRRSGMLPDGHVVEGTRNIAAAWLTGPTGRYAHGALGDRIEAAGLMVELASGKRLALTLDADSVFEDLTPRLADVDGDGADEVLVIRSYLDAGAALSVIEAGAQGLRIVAETPPHGLANRWLNPVGVADFDGDGRIEVALVRTPHIGGTLMLFELKDSALVREHAAFGFSNHANGSRELGLSAVADINGDGVPDLLVPDAARLNLRAVTFAGGQFKELARVAHKGGLIDTAIVTADLDGDGASEAVYGLDDGSLAVVSFGR